ncbi:NUDIX hydrolase [Rubrobacter aplysinae]|uniref:NUDIX hydrolase n=1 Tax=Rubrobacter aplysinae TaxID=909625 RepID=UPI00069F771A|nr:NUDIX domain-containing protein [Rubrobacter aplysinae]
MSDSNNTALQRFSYCPLCGTELSRSEGSGGAYCPVHDHSWYRSSSLTVGCVLIRDGRALVTVRGIEPEKGSYDVPGGFLEAGEHPVDGLRREAREELGVEIEGVKGPVQMAVHRYGEDGDYVLALGFTARIAGGEPAAADDAAGIEWISPEKLEGLDFAWEHDRELVRAALDHEGNNQKDHGNAGGGG